MKQSLIKRQIFSRQIRIRQKQCYFEKIRIQLLNSYNQIRQRQRQMLNQDGIIKMLHQDKIDQIDFKIIERSLTQISKLSQTFKNMFSGYILSKYRINTYALYCLSYVIFKTQSIQFLAQQQTIKTYIPLLILQNVGKQSNATCLLQLLILWYQKCQNKSNFKQITKYYPILMNYYSSNSMWLSLFRSMIIQQQLKPQQQTLKILLEAQLFQQNYLQILYILQQSTKTNISAQVIRMLFKWIDKIKFKNNVQVEMDQMNLILIKVFNNVINANDKDQQISSILLQNQEFLLSIVDLANNSNNNNINIYSINYLCLLVNSLNLNILSTITFLTQLLQAIIQIISKGISFLNDLNVLQTLSLIFMMNPHHYDKFHQYGGQRYLYQCQTSKMIRISYTAANILENFSDTLLLA